MFKKIWKFKYFVYLPQIECIEKLKKNLNKVCEKLELLLENAFKRSVNSTVKSIAERNVNCAALETVGAITATKIEIIAIHWHNLSFRSALFKLTVCAHFWCLTIFPNFPI